MQRSLISVFAALIATLALSGTAVASESARPTPKGNAILSKNPIYTTGEFEFTECKELGRQPDDLNSYQAYLDHLLGCLNQSWAEEFKQAGLAFKKPTVRYIRKSVQTGCGKYPAAYAAGVYCSANKTLWILIRKDQLTDPNELELFTVIAHEYGHYAQDRAGILDEIDRQLLRAGKKKYFALLRKIELQAECLSGAFVGSVWHSLDRDQFDFEDLLDNKQGDAVHGKVKSIRYWMKRGWNGNGPHVCNTFTAPASRLV